jgi:hypothetical protein
VAAAPGGVEAKTVAARSGGGGRGGFIVWYRKKIKKREREQQNIYLRLLLKVEGKRNPKSIGQDFDGIHT